MAPLMDARDSARQLTVQKGPVPDPLSYVGQSSRGDSSFILNRLFLLDHDAATE